MIHDLDALPPDALPEYDLCVVGSGPAGMTLARELCEAGLRLVVLESGLARVSARGDALRAVESEGLPIKEYSRERVFGGASSTWAGLSAPLDPIDLLPRPWVEHSGWPIERQDLLPFWEAAAERYRFASLSHYGPDGFGAVKARGDLSPEWVQLEEKVFLAADPPQDFAAEHGEVFQCPGVDLLLDASVVELLGEGRADSIVAARVVTRHGHDRKVRARCFVLATGGIENARLLLLSTDLCAAGLGNERDQVGRGFMNHPKHNHGLIRLSEPVRELPWHFGCLSGGFAGYAGLRLGEGLQERLGVLNSYVRLEPLFPWSDNRGVEAFVLAMKHSGALLSAFKRRRRGELTSLRDYAETGDDSDLQNARKTLWQRLGLAGTVALSLPMVSRYALSRLSHGRSPPIGRVRLRNFMEMEPRPEQRVELGSARDPNGLPLPLVRHVPSELDRRSLAAVHAAMASDLQANGLGVLEQPLTGHEQPWPIDQDASHHLGATRMGTDPCTSVVDADLRLHEVENLYLAGASVFPTSGCANPTFTIVALSIRLARLLREKLGAPAAQDRAPGLPAAPSAASASSAGGGPSAGDGPSAAGGPSAPRDGGTGS